MSIASGIATADGPITSHHMATNLEFPKDENGDVLRRMQADGDDLSKARDIDFTVTIRGQTTG
jgi:hypothetical protein